MFKSERNNKVTEIKEPVHLAYKMSEVNDEPTSAKVQKLSSEVSSEPDSSLIDKTQKILENIGSCQTEIDSLNEQASEEILKVEQKYNKLRRPHFEKRNQLIDDIPNFWVTTFINHPQLGSILAEEDVQCLRYLKQLCVEEYEDIKSGYKISFTFNKNPFFTNDVLTKEFHLSTSKGSPYTKSTPVYWNDNMDLTDRSKLSPRSKKRKRGQTSSFFSWYKASTDPTSDELAEVLKDDIWPNPLQYFLTSSEVNGISDDSSDESDGMDDSVVVVGDDDDDDEDDVYEVEHDDSDDDFDDSDILGQIGDSIHLVDDDDDDEVEVISDVEEIMDSSKDVGETTLETTQDVTADSILDDTADDEILEATGDDILEDTVDDSILNDTADASIDNLDETQGASDDKKEKDGVDKVTQEVAEEDVNAETAKADGGEDAGSKVEKHKSMSGSKDEAVGDGGTEGDGGGE